MEQTPVRNKVAEQIQWLQLGALIITFCGILMTLGRKDAALEQAVVAVKELQAITIDLAKTQARMLETDRNQEGQLAQITVRLHTLEMRNANDLRNSNERTTK